MNRKQFLVNSTLLAFSVSACATVFKKNGKNITESNNCETTNDILGPFYRKNSPERKDLTLSNSIGNQITIKGKVYKSDCTSVIENAVIEIWHCNPNGEYDNTSPEFKYRGQQKSDNNGAYQFKTILPGKYLNGDLYRPAHIHFRIKHSKSKELISQIYFQGDPHIIKDPWASKTEATQRILPIILEDTNGSISINFNIYLIDK